MILLSFAFVERADRLLLDLLHRRRKAMKSRIKWRTTRSGKASYPTYVQEKKTWLERLIKWFMSLFKKKEK